MQAFFIYNTLNYFFKNENKISIANNPTKPDPPKLVSKFVTLLITSTPNIDPLPNKISTATPNPKRDITNPVKPMKKSLKYLNTLSIIYC